MLTLEDVTIEVLATQEILPVEGRFESFEEDTLSASIVKEVHDRLNRGDVWAWADVEVKVSWNHWSASSYLGACSYENEEDFKKCDYYHQLVKEALEELNGKLKDDYKLLFELHHKDDLTVVIPLDAFRGY